MTLPHNKASTNEELQPEPHCESSNHLDDSSTDDRTQLCHHQESDEATQHSSKANGPNEEKKVRLDIDSSSRLPKVFFRLSDMVYTQYTDEWIDEAESMGGRRVRAILSSAASHIWAQGVATASYYKGSTYTMNEKEVAKKLDNPTAKVGPKLGKVRRAARHRARWLKSRN
jgi:hypothetical protein|tara:strand:+ start:700 stop:1212 length:513 start_codon:yes stop_codon:yes gene_type:complete